MADDELESLHHAAREWLEAAEAEALAGRHLVAFESARHAAELACKAILLLRVGSYPKMHDVSGLLSQREMLPSGVSGRSLSRLLSAFTSGTYGEGRPVDAPLVTSALHVARLCLAAMEE